MKKEQLDELYHLLRVISNEAAEADDRDQNDAIVWLTRHLLEGGYYLGLIKYAAFYGERFLLQPTYEAIRERGWEFDRIVEFGAGLGWLCRGLASRFRIADVLTVDKRPWGAISISADLETQDGIKEVWAELREGDLIVTSDFLHCVNNPANILKEFSSWPMAILEYMPTNEDYTSSYTTQLGRYGGNPIQSGELGSMLHRVGRKTDIQDLDPYVLILIDREKP